MAAFSTLAMVGLAAFQASQTIKQSKAEAQSIVDQADLAAASKAKETKLKAARIQSSFLTSGLTLEGTPMSTIQSTFDTGLEDVNQITTNANTQAKQTISAGRTGALTSLASTAMGTIGSGDLFSGSGTFGSQGSVSRSLEFGSTSGVGPIQSFGGF